MGYSTQFSGELKFTHEATASQLAHLQLLLGEDRRKHPEWNAPDVFYYIDLEITPAFDGLRWSEAEKSYGLEEAVNVVIREMRKKWLDFGLTGEMLAQGEDSEDRWVLRIGDDGFAHKIKVPILGQRVMCPHCGERFILEGE